jgi:hypothetical protein
MKRCHRFFVLAFVLTVALCRVSRADDVFVSQFNDAGSLSGWRFDYGGATNGVANVLAFDPSQDASNNPASGALKVMFQFDAALNSSGNNKGAVTLDFSGAMNGSEFLTMEMDLKIAEGSAADGSGNSGYFQMVIRNTGGYSFNSQFGGNVGTNSGWRHISVPAMGARDDIRAVTLELYGGANLNGPVTFFVDNIKFTKPGLVTDVFVSRFDTAASRTGWRFDYGSVTNLIAFEPGQDASNNVSSGSLKIVVGYDSALLGNNLGAFTYDLPSPISGVDFLTIEMDVKVEAGSVADASGDSGFLQVVTRTGPGYDFDAQIATTVHTNSGWQHLSAGPLAGSLDDIRAITLEFAGNLGLDGPATFYIDNLKFTKPVGPPVGPAMAVELPIRGLNLIPASGQYERQNIASVSTNGLGWLGAADPVTYAVTIARYPGASYSGFQTHLFLVSGAPAPASSPDYTQPHVVFLDIQSRADGTAAAAFRYKVNEPNGNTFLYGAGTLGQVTNPTPVGTWSLTFSQNTNATVTSPNGNMATFTLPDSAAALFTDPLTLYVGAQPNAAANIGQLAVLGRFQLKRGATTIIDDNFSNDDLLNTAIWQVAAGTPAGVQIVGTNASFWLTWTIPDAGFLLQATSTVADPGSWATLGWSVPQMGSRRRVLVQKFTTTPDPIKFYEPDPNYSFFRLQKPAP